MDDKKIKKMFLVLQKTFMNEENELSMLLRVDYSNQNQQQEQDLKY